MPEDEDEVHDDFKTDTCVKEREVLPTEPGEDENDCKSNSVELTIVYLYYTISVTTLT